MRTRSAIAAVAAGVVILVAYQLAVAAPHPTADPYPVPLTIREVGIRLEAPGQGAQAQISQDLAIAAADRAAGSLGDVNKPFSAQLVRLTDPNYGPEDGPLVIENRLVWLIRFTGTEQPLYGGVDPLTGDPMADRVPANEIATELNVVIDATTGEHLESFSYR